MDVPFDGRLCACRNVRSRLRGRRYPVDHARQLWVRVQCVCRLRDDHGTHVVHTCGSVTGFLLRPCQSAELCWYRGNETCAMTALGILSICACQRRPRNLQRLVYSLSVRARPFRSSASLRLIGFRLKQACCFDRSWPGPSEACC